MDFFPVPTLTFGVLYCFFVIGHDRRKILHFNVTRNPSALSLIQQLRKAWVSHRATEPRPREGKPIDLKDQGKERPDSHLYFLEPPGDLACRKATLFSNLAKAVAGEPIRGSWWGHKKGRTIFWATLAVRNSSDVLVCRLQDGKVSYIHRRLWPAVVRLADWLDGTKLVAIHEEHKPSGANKLHLIPFPKWVPMEIRQSGKGAFRAGSHFPTRRLDRWHKTTGIACERPLIDMIWAETKRL